jgi:hypothetical protein
MPTEQLPRGSNLQLFINKQSAFKTPAAGDYLTTFAYSFGMAESRPNQDDPILGTPRQNDRDATEPSQDVASFAGPIAVPLDFPHLRYWLELLLGAPSTSGTAPNFVHTFTSGALVLPEATIERKLARPGGSIFLQSIGVMANRATLQASRQGGFARFSLDCTGYGEDKLAASEAGTPVVPVARDPIHAALGVYRKGGTPLGRVLEASLTYDNMLSPREEIGDVRVAGYDFSEPAKLTGTLRVRLTDTTLFDEAVATTPHAGELLFEKSAARSLSLAMPIVRMERPPIAVEGPGFLDVTYNLRAEQDSDSAMLTAVLKGAQETF